MKTQTEPRWNRPGFRLSEYLRNTHGVSEALLNFGAQVRR